MNKKCTGCLESKSISMFGKNAWNKDGLHHRCKKCIAKYRNSPKQKKYQKWFRSGPLGRAYLKKSYKSRRIWSRRYKLKKYGLTIEEHKKMFLKQKGRCAICGVHQSDLKCSKRFKLFSVDHCHKTGRVRGLICNTCNTSLGGFKDSIKILKSAIRYLCTR